MFVKANKILLEKERLYVHKVFALSMKLNYMNYTGPEGKSSDKAVIQWVHII